MTGRGARLACVGMVCHSKVITYILVVESNSKELFLSQVFFNISVSSAFMLMYVMSRAQIWT